MTLNEFERELENLREREKNLEKIANYIFSLDLNKSYAISYGSFTINIIGDNLKAGLIKEFESTYENYWSGLEKLRNCGLTITQINKDDYIFREVRHLMK